MRCYIVQGPGIRRYAGTNALSKITRNEMIEKHGFKKSDIQIEETDISLAKKDLLEFVNSLCEEFDRV